MDKYAEGKVIETATGYIVSIGEPIDVEVTVPEGSTEVSLHAEEGTKWIDINTQYLVTLEVNGVKELYRELWTSGDYGDNNSVSIGNHSYTMDDCYLSDFTEGDVVRIRFEDVEVLTTDAFRAAVKKVAPVGGGSGSSGSGGPLVVTLSRDTSTGTPIMMADKTLKEIYDASCPAFVLMMTATKRAYGVLDSVSCSDNGGNVVLNIANQDFTLHANTPNEYPKYVQSEEG